MSSPLNTHLIKVNETVLNYIVESTIRNNGFNSSSDLKYEIYNVFGLNIDFSTIRYYRRKIGFKYRRTKKRPFLTHAQKNERLIWCLTHQNLTFDDFIFVDETAIKTLECPLYHLRFPRTYPAASFKNNLDKFGYLEILCNNLIPFALQNFGSKSRLFQDNDSKHSSKICVDVLRSSRVFWDRTPTYSPDLNPIEDLWKDMKDFCRKRMQNFGNNTKLDTDKSNDLLQNVPIIVTNHKLKHDCLLGRDLMSKVPDFNKQVTNMDNKIKTSVEHITKIDGISKQHNLTQDILSNELVKTENKPKNDENLKKKTVESRDKVLINFNQIMSYNLTISKPINNINNKTSLETNITFDLEAE
ncbi:unnamed protein product [Brachionus calyciflorus]|uniref:Tc1-like transposase DDE domain-containing protein n=1 Tax=Brachionus calyciflorus TaxID=104777 RepID=A0A813RT85_9BILA|nr:unnamed protein product [Brachionus calyciflorus]